MRVPSGTCLECGVQTRRRGVNGTYPKRCPEHASATQRDQARIRTARAREQHPERCERDRATYAAWYAANAEQARAQALQWYYDNTEQAAETNARWYRENGDKSRAKAHYRRAVRRGVEAEKFSPREIHERDGWICQLCDEPVDQDLAWPDPLSASLDHIIPLSHGGPHTRANTRLAHLVCNTRRGAAMT